MKAKTRQELANKMGMSVRTMMRKLSREGVSIPSGLLPPLLQKVIFEKLMFTIDRRTKDLNNTDEDLKGDES